MKRHSLLRRKTVVVGPHLAAFADLVLRNMHVRGMPCNDPTTRKHWASLCRDMWTLGPGYRANHLRTWENGLVAFDEVESTASQISRRLRGM